MDKRFNFKRLFDYNDTISHNPNDVIQKDIVAEGQPVIYAESLDEIFDKFYEVMEDNNLCNPNNVGKLVGISHDTFVPFSVELSNGGTKHYQWIYVLEDRFNPNH